MIIAQISDTHIDPESDKLKDRLMALESVVADINALNPAPDIVIHTGDIVHNGTQEKYDLALTILKNIQVPLYVCPGNRDDRDLIYKNFHAGRNISASSKFLQYSIEEYPVRLIALDTICSTSNMGDYCQERADTLTNILAEAPHKPTVLFMHHPPFEVVDSQYPFQFENWDTVNYLTNVLKKTKQVKHLFCGHTHRNSNGIVTGIPASTSPSIAVDLRLGVIPKDGKFKPMYQIHNFDGTRFKSKTLVC